MEIESPILTTTRLLQAFADQGVESMLVNARLNLLKFRGSQGGWNYVKGAISEHLPAISLLICNDKLWCEEVLISLGIPTPVTLLHRTFDESMVFMVTNGSIVVKPRDAAHGNGIQLNVSTEEQLFAAIQYAKKFSKDVLLQTYCEGGDIRVLIIDGKFVSAVERIPASVVGDGKQTVAELILFQNFHNPFRNANGQLPMHTISDEAVSIYLSPEEQKFIPEAGMIVRVVGPANISLGGSLVDGLPLVTESIKEDAEKIAKFLQMPVAGVDFMSSKSGHYMIEVNASPGMDIHNEPYWNVESDCFDQYAKWLYTNS